MATDNRSLPPSEVVLFSTPAGASLSRWRRFKNWTASQWAAIRPGPEARRGAVWGTLAAAAITVIIGGLYIRTGFGYLFDFAFCILFATLFIPLIALIVALLLTLFRKLPPFATGFIFGACMIVMALWGRASPELGAFMAIGMGLSTGFLGATIATFFWGNFGQSTVRKKLVVAVLFLLSLSGCGYYIFLFAYEGSLDKLLAWKPPADYMPSKLSASDPSARGPYRVLTLFYGVGNDIRRPEYGPGVAIKTRTVDSSDFFEDFKGCKRWARNCLFLKTGASPAIGSRIRCT
ncbi:MAG: hypothetical protein ACLQBK_03635 [Candidatus Sulfotelmatobacter sp.]